MYCNKCGKEIDDEAVVCIHCGCAVNGVKRSKVSEEAVQPLSKGMVLLCTFLPVMGIVMGLVELSKNDNSKIGIQYISQSIAGFIVWGIIIGSAIAAMYFA